MASLIEQMRALKIKKEKKRDKRPNTNRWVKYISKPEPWGHDLMQHVINHFEACGVDAASRKEIKFRCENHEWRKIRKDKYAKPEPFIYPD